jgi:hypothetical protein
MDWLLDAGLTFPPSYPHTFFPLVLCFDRYDRLVYFFKWEILQKHSGVSTLVFYLKSAIMLKSKRFKWKQFDYTDRALKTQIKI